MSKHYSKKRRLKYVFLALAVTASFSLTGLAAACKPDDEENKETGKTTSVEDTQLLKNGDFEFFTVPDKKDGEPAPEYLINSPTSWTRGGTSPYTMSGIIGTSDKAWKKLTADDIAERLDANNALDSSASDYKEKHIDFNGMKSSDLLYKDSYGALKYSTIKSEKDGDNTKYYIGEGDGKVEIYYDESKENGPYFYDKELTKPVSKEFISNPEAHNIFKEEGKAPYYLNDKGEKQEIFEDENGDYYLEYDKDKNEYSESVGHHVLMLHNYSNSTHNGIAQNYASVDVSLPANTSAEISVWVKTANLLFSQGQYVNDDQDHGANITVTHTVGNSTLDDFAITSINTEKLIGSNKASAEYNGWVQYTVYVNACNFASSTISLKLGLGETDKPVEGYAFFDDISVKKFIDLTDEGCTYSQNKDKIGEAKCDLTSDPSEKIFVADTYERSSSDGSVNDKRFSENFHYLLDLASESDYEYVNLSGAKAGLTVDSDKYTSSLNKDTKLVGLTSSVDENLKVKLPTELKNLKGEAGLTTKDDLLALVSANYPFTAADSPDYYKKLNEALSSVPDKDNPGNQMLVLFSARGAAYTASFDLTIKEEGYQIISFWVKTSDMGGSTASIIKITEDGNKDNSANITLDTTGITTDIDDDNKDIYNGWVQCFFFVHNDTKKVAGKDNPATLHIEFSFGNTTLNGTTVTSYKAGWAALANVQILDDVKEDVFAYTGSGNYTASLTVSEDTDKKTTSSFDEAYGSLSHNIKNDIVDPNSYYGTNGGSTKVKKGESSNPYDDKNPNDWAGLINKDYFENYASKDWYSSLLTSFGVNTSSTDALANWNEIFGSKSVQPLIIVNKLRKGYVQEKAPNEANFANYYIKNDKGEIVEVDPAKDKFDKDTTYYTVQEVINYGFIGPEKTVASDGFTTVSVKVKVSAGAVAYIYLVDTTNSENVLSFNAPSYSFWYDDDGNVLKAELDEKANREEQLANILYTLRDDGLYEADNKLYANLYNYTKLYSANVKYYKDGKEYSVDDLIAGETYYKNEACTVEADHYLVTNDGKKIFECKNEKYYYIVNGVTQKDEVNGFDKAFARYDYSEINSDPDKKIKYMEVVEDTNGEWVTVNFVIHAGSATKNYRLELWSGERGEYTTDGNTENGAVLFDYSYTSVTSNDLLNEYENEIIKAYQTLLADEEVLEGIASSTENISYYEKLIEENIKAGNISQTGIDKYETLKNSYNAHYYTYSLYDSADFQPFNKEVADATASGYDYKADNYEESLAYLYVKKGNDRTIFTDYSTIDQSISLDLGSNDEDEDNTDKEEDKNTTNVWLLASSIILVVALLFAMGAILLRDLLKNRRRNKALNKNTYNTNKANRYIKKLGIKKEEIEEVDAPAEETAKQPVEETVEEPEVAEQPAEETETPEESSDNNEGQE